MKCIQIIIFPIQIYDKIELSDEIDKIFPGIHETIMYLLFRRTIGNPYNIESVLEMLFSEVFDIIDNDAYDVKWISLDPNFANPTIFSNTTFDEFLKSPSNPTDKFIEEYGNKTLNTIIPGFSPTSINKMFVSDDQNIDMLPDEIVNNNVIDVKQKSQEWLGLNKIYQCGLNTGVNKFEDDSDGSYGFVSFYYNLIR